MHGDFTIEVEAKAKELAVERLAEYLRGHGVEERDVPELDGCIDSRGFDVYKG